MFVAPWIIGFALFFIIPIYQSLRLSFSEIVRLIGFEMEFVGLDNYAKAFMFDINFVPMFLEVIKNTAINTPLIIVFSLVIAILLNKKIRLKGLLRGVFYLPVLLGTGFVMQQLLGQNISQRAIDISSGILVPAGILKYLGPGAYAVIENLLGRTTIILWKCGVPILLSLAGLQGISPTLYEAAKVDGVTGWEMFWKITLPMMSPIILLNIVYVIIDSFNDSANPILDYVINYGIRKSKFGYAAAMSWIYFVFVFVVVLVIFGLLGRRIYQTDARKTQ